MNPAKWVTNLSVYHRVSRENGHLVARYRTLQLFLDNIIRIEVIEIRY